MKKVIVTVIMGLVMAAGSLSVLAEMQSLRGANALDKEAEMFNKRSQEKKKGGFERSYKIQPPLIPHSTEKDEITLKGNTCMKCHSEKNYKKEKAPKVGDSHYVDRDGKTLAEVSSRRWFCTQCHATQVDATPLVENNF